MLTRQEVDSSSSCLLFYYVMALHCRRAAFVAGSSHGKINAGTVAGRNFIPWEGSVPWELFSKSITSPLRGHQTFGFVAMR